MTSSRQSNAFWLYLVQLICCALVFGFSLKNGLGGFSKTDKLCIFLCIIALAFKVVVGSGIVAIILASFVECTAFYLSFTKLLKHPGGEYQLQWLLSTVTGLLAFMSLKSFSVSFSLYPIIITMGNAAVTALIYTQNSNVPITLDNGSV